jgi:hypothetical protein
MPASTMRRSVLGAVLAILVAIAASVAVVAASGTADAASMTKCGRWAQHQYTRSRECIRIGRIDSILDKTDSYLLHNSHYQQTIHASCSWTHATTWTWHVDASVKAEAGLIFEKVSAEVSSGVAHSTTDSTTLGFSFKIPPRHWAYCARGHAGFKVTGRAYTENCGNLGCDRTNKRSFTARIPSVPFIDNGGGRNIDWSQYLVH